MIIKNNSNVREEFLQEEEIKNVTKKILIGPGDGSDNIIMRHFKVLPGGYTYFHSHDFEHVVKIEKGEGMVVNKDGKEIAVSEGQSIFIDKNEKHQFKNSSKEPFEFLCIIINPDKN